MLTSLSSYGQDVGSGEITLVAKGMFVPGDRIVVWNQALDTTFSDASTLEAKVPKSTFAAANYGTVVVRRSATGQSYPLPFESTPKQTAKTNSVVGLNSAVLPDYGLGPGMLPPKGGQVTQSVTGAVIERLSDTEDAKGEVSNFRNIYSKWSSVNATGEYMFVEKEDSFTSYLYRIADHALLGKITTSTVSASVGENLEPRWSTRGDEPYTIYYLDGSGGGFGGKRLLKKDVVNNTAEIVVKDFSAALGLGDEFLYCDSEGTPSIDMRFWAFMRRDSLFIGAREFLVYDSLLDTVTRAKPVAQDGFFGLGVAAIADASNDFAVRPNWISMSPRGDRVQLGYDNAEADQATHPLFGTSVDGVQTFRSEDWGDPRPCAASATHGAWSWGPEMQQSWTCQNNRVDATEVTLDVVGTNVFKTGTSASDYAYPQADPASNGRRAAIALSGSWNNGYKNDPGQHYMWQMSGRRRGFSFMGTDGTYDPNAYGYNSILAIRHTDGRIWRVASLPHQYRQGDYSTEVQWAISPLALTLHGSLNWQNTPEPSLKREVYLIQLDAHWSELPLWD